MGAFGKRQAILYPHPRVKHVQLTTTAIHMGAPSNKLIWNGSVVLALNIWVVLERWWEVKS